MFLTPRVAPAFLAPPFPFPVTPGDFERLATLARRSGGPFVLVYRLIPHVLPRGLQLEPAALLELKVTGWMGAGFVPCLSQALTGDPLALTTAPPGAATGPAAAYRIADILQQVRGPRPDHQA